MANKMRRKNIPEEEHKQPDRLAHYFKAFSQITIMPFIRIGKQGFLMQRTEPYGNIIIDGLCVSLVFGIFLMLNWWVWVAGLAIMLTIPVCVGATFKVSKSLVKNIQVSKEQSIEEQVVSQSYDNVAELVKDNQQAKIIEKNRKYTTNEVPNFDESDTAKWAEYIRQHPEKVSGTRKS